MKVQIKTVVVKFATVGLALAALAATDRAGQLLPNGLGRSNGISLSNGLGTVNGFCPTNIACSAQGVAAIVGI